MTLLLIINSDDHVETLAPFYGPSLSIHRDLYTLEDMHKFGGSEFCQVHIVGKKPTPEAMDYLRARIRVPQ